MNDTDNNTMWDDGFYRYWTYFCINNLLTYNISRNKARSYPGFLVKNLYTSIIKIIVQMY